MSRVTPLVSRVISPKPWFNGLTERQDYENARTVVQSEEDPNTGGSSCRARAGVVPKPPPPAVGAQSQLVATHLLRGPAEPPTPERGRSTEYNPSATNAPVETGHYEGA